MPNRTCAVCKKKGEKYAFTRHICHPDTNTFLADTTQKLPGRGWYLCSQKSCQEKFKLFPLTRNIR